MLIRLLARISHYPRALRGFAALMSLAVLLFLIDTYFVFWTNWPGTRAFFSHLGILPAGRGFQPLEGYGLAAGWVQFMFNAAAVMLLCIWVWLTPKRSIGGDARICGNLASYFVRLAFWAVLLIGIADSFISFLRVEGLLPAIVGEHLATQLGRSVFRGTWIHYPLIVVGAAIALKSRSLDFIWLALLIVAAEFTIVVSRFVFSYEQAFQGDAVRFWYAGLFLFASAYTLTQDGHVRVDVLYANFSEQGKAVTNALGSLFLGLPICWTILALGTGSRGSIIISPLLSYEISQSGFGMYTKYLMAGFLLVFAVSMAFQFIALFLESMSRFLEPSTDQEERSDAHPPAAMMGNAEA